jgi:hypothetical protein
MIAEADDREMKEGQRIGEEGKGGEGKRRFLL